jgi:Leucine rich repeat
LLGFLSIISRCSADIPCQWNEFDRNQPTLKITTCESPTIASIFLGRVSKEPENFPKLETLSIQTSLVVIEEARFTRAINLKTLVLSNNKIRSIHEKAFNGLHKLKDLSIDQNELHSLPINGFADLLVLEGLNVDKNQLTSFDFSIVQHNTKLNWLTISRNVITHVQTSKQFAFNLQTISMERNFLASLCLENLPKVPILKFLFIDGNNLTEFDFESVKDKLPQLQKIHFGYNPFDCCYLVEMVTEMLLHMPSLKIDCDFAKLLNDSKAFKHLSKCVSCARPFRNQRRINELETIVSNDDKINKVLISVLALVAVVQIIVGSVCFWYLKKATKVQSRVESDYMEIPPRFQ